MKQKLSVPDSLTTISTILFQSKAHVSIFLLLSDSTRNLGGPFVTKGSAAEFGTRTNNTNSTEMAQSICIVFEKVSIDKRSYCHPYSRPYAINPEFGQSCQILRATKNFVEDRRESPRREWELDIHSVLVLCSAKQWFVCSGKRSRIETSLCGSRRRLEDSPFWIVSTRLRSKWIGSRGRLIFGKYSMNEKDTTVVTVSYSYTIPYPILSSSSSYTILASMAFVSILSL